MVVGTAQNSWLPVGALSLPSPQTRALPQPTRVELTNARLTPGFPEALRLVPFKLALQLVLMLLIEG